MDHRCRLGFKFRDENCCCGIVRRINRVAGSRLGELSAVVQQLELRCIVSQLRAPSHDSSDREFSEAVDDSRLPCEDSCARGPDALSLIHSPWIDAVIDRRAPPGSKTLENADMIGTWTNRRYQSVTSTGSVAVTQAHSSATQSSRPSRPDSKNPFPPFTCCAPHSM